MTDQVVAIVTAGDLLDRVADFERHLEQYYADIRDQSRANGVRLLAYFLRRHRRHLPEALKEFTPPVIEYIRKIRLKRAIPFIPEKEFQALGTPPAEVHGRQLLEAAVRYDAALVRLYRKILEQPLIGQAQELFDSLIQVEEHDIVRLQKMAAMNCF